MRSKDLWHCTSPRMGDTRSYRSARSAALVAGVGPYEPRNGGERRCKGDLSGAPDTQNMKGEEMDLILRFRCDSCHKEFMVADEQVDAEYLNCPHCPGEVEVPEDEESDEEEE